ncbi:MAG TPA: quinoprotein dehydrogenase-associated putative ABC transporter substrate-binding protein [Steroidobacteraceae bacterium]
MKRKTFGAIGRSLLALGLLGAGANGVAVGASLQSLTVCADPGNMPLSDEKGAGFENKIAEIIGKALGTGVHYYWRPSIERGLMRTTLSAGNCDLWMDMAADTEGAQVLAPLYRSTFVLAYRNDKGIHIQNLDDPALKKLRVGVFQVSAIREALSDHGVVANTVIHYLSHNADIVEDNQPSYQIQQVVNGELDIAAAWGPMAGYYKTVKHDPLVIQPVNLMEDKVPMEFDMALAVPRGRADIKSAVEQALAQHKGEIRQVLVDFGVPLVKCAQCLVDGDLPSHGPYAAPVPDAQAAALESRELAKERALRMAALKQSLAHGGNPNEELNNAVTANDPDRVRYTLAHHANINATDGDGKTALINATRFGFNAVATELLEQKADPNLADRGGWTPLMYAAWNDDPTLAKSLLAHGAKIDVSDNDRLTALAIAAQNGKAKVAPVLIGAGADVNAPAAKGGYTPLMLAAISGSGELATALIAHGARVNATNPGGVTALMIAAANDHPSLAELLLKSGADVNARSEDGRTALGIAQERNNETLVRLLQGAAQRPAPKSS